MKRAKKVAIGIAIVSALTCAALVLAQQQAPMQRNLKQQQAVETSRNSRMMGIEVVRNIETAEVEHKAWHGAFADWGELYSAPDEQKRWQSLQVSAGPEVIPGWKLKLVASADGEHFEVSLQNIADKCGFSFFSDEHGVIYQGGAIDCSIELKPTS